MKSNDLLVFPHCPKTGGTTLKERYRHGNESFVVTDLGDRVTDKTKVAFGHSVQIGEYDKQFDKNIVYLTCVRDPISRIMSMYNFYRTQLFYLNPDSPDVDFYLWFINKDVIRPMPVTKQYEYFLYQHVDVDEWFADKVIMDNTVVNDMYNNTVLTWDVKEDKSFVDNKKIQKRLQEKNKIETHNMEVTWERIMDKMNHVFFQCEDIVSKFDDIVAHYRLDLKVWDKMTVTNETKYDLKRHKLEYVSFFELDEDLQYLVELDLQADIEFFKRCQQKWKH